MSKKNQVVDPPGRYSWVDNPDDFNEEITELIGREKKPTPANSNLNLDFRLKDSAGETKETVTSLAPTSSPAFQIKDSGTRRKFATGAQRDRGDIKPRPDLIHPYFLARFGILLAKGAVKYSAWNWSKGMPLSDWMASLCRHVIAAMTGDESEDHLSAICFNAMGFMVTQAGIRVGIYSTELDDLAEVQLSKWSKLIEQLVVSKS